MASLTHKPSNDLPVIGCRLCRLYCLPFAPSIPYSLLHSGNMFPMLPRNSATIVVEVIPVSSHHRQVSLMLASPTRCQPPPPRHPSIDANCFLSYRLKATIVATNLTRNNAANSSYNHPGCTLLLQHVNASAPSA